MGERELTEMLVRIDERVERLLHVVEGNDRPGLLERVTTLEALTKDIDNRAPSKREKVAAWSAIAVAVVSAVGGVAVAWVSAAQ